MPQPLSKVNPNALVHTGFSTDPNRIELTQYVMRSISSWAYIDHLVASMLSNFLKADYTVTAAMYEALSSVEAKKAAFLAAARNAVPDGFPLIQAVLEATKASRRRRNEFAHHVWAHSPDLDDALILVDPAALTEQMFAMRQMAADGTFAPKATKVGKAYRLELPPIPAIDGRRLKVFRRRELEWEAIGAEQCVGAYKTLSRATSLKHPDEKARDLLLSEPRIQRALSKLYPENNPPAPPQPPR